jgi:hypothetical protein
MTIKRSIRLLTEKSITTALTDYLGPEVFVPNGIQSIVAQGNFVYGSGGTSLDAYLQTTVDNGETWIDIANWNFTTSSARVIHVIGMAYPQVEAYTALDGSIAANTIKDGILGSLLRVKLTTTGTYAATTIEIAARFVLWGPE